MFRSILWAVALMAPLALPAAAQSQLHVCSLQGKRMLGWISESMGFVFDGSGGVKVIDGLILNHVGKPIEAKAKRRGDKIKVQWAIRGAEDNSGQRVSTFSFSATLNTKTNGIVVYARPVGYSNKLRGDGTCEIRKDAKGFFKS